MPWSRLAPLVPFAAVVGMVALLAAAGRLPTGDATHLATVTLSFADLLRGGHVPQALALWAGQVAPQPPVGFVPGVLAALVLGETWLTMLVAGGVALLVAWDALRRLGGSSAAAGLVLLASPMVWLYVEAYGWDLLCAAAVLQALSWLRRAEGFTDRRAALLFGAWMGLGFLTKYTFPMFLWLPCLWEARRLRDRAAWANLGRAAGVFALLVGPWLALNAGDFGAYLGRSVGEGAEAAVQGERAGANRFTAEALALYPLALKDALGWPGVVVLLGAGIAGFRGVPAVGPLSAVGGLGVLSLLEQSQDRYALPALAGLSTLALGLGRLRWGQEVFVGVFLALLAGTVATFRPGAPAARAARYDHPLASAAALSWPRSRSYGPTDVDLATWKVDEGLLALREAHGSDHGVVGLLIPDTPALLDPGVYLLRARLLGNRWDVRVVRPRGDEPPRNGWPKGDVRALYAVWRPAFDGAAHRWIGEHARVAAFTLPGGVEGAVITR